LIGDIEAEQIGKERKAILHNDAAMRQGSLCIDQGESSIKPVLESD